MNSRSSFVACSSLLLVVACSEPGQPMLGTGGGMVGGSGAIATGGGPGVGGGVGASGSGTGGGNAAGGIGSGGAGNSGGVGGVGGASGGEPSGGADGAGGGTGGIVNTVPPFTPNTVSTGDLQSAYETWKAIHLEDCGGGVWRVPWENAKLDSTVSEGIGYGMLLTVAFDDRTAFDGVFAYAKKMRAGFSDGLTNKGENGLMNWLRYGCDAHRETKYSNYPDFAASDADLDVAMALIMAKCRWGESAYGDEANVVINAIKEHMFMDFNGMHVLQPGDSDWFDKMGNGCVNYSYFAPAYYRAFAAQVSGDADFWNQAARDTYSLLSMASNSSTGLVRNWGSSDGNQATDECHNSYNRAGSYGDDAARTPWRVATDFLWYGTPEAKSWNDKVTTWVKSQGIENIVQWYNLDGTPDTEAGTWDDHTAIDIGPFTVGAMTYDQQTVDAFASELLAIPTASGSHDAEYFPRMLKTLSLLTLTGKFTQCGGK